MEILTANLGFLTTASSKKISLGDYNDDRQPEMAVETGNTYISETMRDINKIPTANLRFTKIYNHRELEESVGK